MARSKYHYHLDSKAGEYFIEKGCNDCRDKYDNETSVCSFCWKDVSNKVYLSKNSAHQSGKCRDRSFLDVLEWELENRRPRHVDWRYAANGTATARSWNGGNNNGAIDSVDYEKSFHVWHHRGGSEDYNFPTNLEEFNEFWFSPRKTAEKAKTKRTKRSKAA